MKKGILYTIIIILVWIIAYLCYDKFLLANTNENKVSEPKDIFQKWLECQELLDKYKADKPSPEYISIWIFYSPIKNTCIWYYIENYTSEPTTYQIDDILWGLTSYYTIYDKDFCACSSDFLWGSYNPTSCEKYYISPQREKEINWLKWIWEKPEL